MHRWCGHTPTIRLFGPIHSRSLLTLTKIWMISPPWICIQEWIITSLPLCIILIITWTIAHLFSLRVLQSYTRSVKYPLSKHIPQWTFWVELQQVLELGMLEHQSYRAYSSSLISPRFLLACTYHHLRLYIIVHLRIKDKLFYIVQHPICKWSYVGSVNNFSIKRRHITVKIISEQLIMSWPD